MSITLETLEQFFQKYGWKIKKYSAYIGAGVKIDEGGQFTLITTVDNDWISLTIPNFLTIKEYHERLLIQLLIFNDQFRGVKLGINDDLVSFSLDLPTQLVKYDSFVLGLEALITYANTIWPLLKDFPIED